MQQNGQEQQKHRSLQESQDKQEGELLSVPTSTQEEQQPAVQMEVEECLNLLRRTQADFINYRRRISQEQTEGRLVAQSELLSRLLPIFDDLGRAVEATPAELATNPWVQGLFLIIRRLSALLDQLGVKQIGAAGEPFDPRWHEAITTEMRTDVPEGTILRVIQPGYLLGDRVVRPAQVSVAGTPSSMDEVSMQ